MTAEKTDTEELIQRAAASDCLAIDQLFDRHRGRLRRMIEVRFDQRLAQRLDPSDIVQEVLIKAVGKLPEYVIQRPIAFYPWLRQLAWDQMVEAFRTHIVAQKRTVNREVRANGTYSVPLPDQSAVLLADVLVDGQISPSQQMEHNQMKKQVQAALDKVAISYREVLIMRHLEQLSMREIADCLGISEAAVKMRHFRALKQLGKALTPPGSSDE